MRTYLLKNPDKIREVVGKLNLLNTGEANGSDTRYRVIQRREIPTQFLIAKEEAKIIGWCARFGSKETHLFITKRQRRKGFGSRLLKRMTREAGVCLVVPWCSSAEKFYQNHFGKKIVNIYKQA